MNNPSALEFEFISENHLAGFRLQRLELLNWGTFHQKVWKLDLNGQNGLLTGDIGSGKSTVVDAITTLLVPTQKIAYNKAAGAETKERNLRSYVLGYYKSERDSETGAVKPAQLRNNQNYSVILGVFYNQGYDQYITLAQVFWIKDQQSQPAKFFVGAEQVLSIAEDFANFGTELTALRKKLRQHQCDTFDTFPPYAAWFRRRFGIQNDQALELFHQTVSMKSVGNLTDFVRTHMLEPFEETQARIDHLLLHFDDLNRAYQSVLKAKDQVALLTPIVAMCEQYQVLKQDIASIEQLLTQLPPYLSRLKLSLLTKYLQELTEKCDENSEHLTRIAEHKTQQVQAIEQIKWDIQQNGGNRLTELSRQIEEKQKLKIEREAQFASYQKYIQQLDEILVNHSQDFIKQKTRLAQRLTTIQQQEITYNNQEVESTADLRQITTILEAIEQEILSLKKRESNIPRHQIEIRHALCNALQLPETQFPFVGELLQIKATEKDWEGAIERLLHHFALSLIVPDAYYHKVADWINQHHLKGKIVYYRVSLPQTSQEQPLHPISVIHKLEIKPDSPYFEWLENELYKRFDFAACPSIEQFRREVKAITQSGQIKDKSGRHEKDDRYTITDRSRYILGWSNKDKITLLQKNANQNTAKLQEIEQQIIHYKQTRQRLKRENDILIHLERFSTFNDIDVESVIKDITNLNDERASLTSASNILHQLNQQLEILKKALQQTEEQERNLFKEKGGLEKAQEDAQTEYQLTAQSVEEMPIDTNLNPQFDQLLAESLTKRNLTLQNINQIKEMITNKLQTDQKQKQQTQNKQSQQIVVLMNSFKHKYPLETSEFDASVEAYFEYESLLHRLNSDDLPRFVAQFKQLLNENTINEIANLNAQLNREKETIKQRIGQINQSLQAIDYNPGRYISLEPQLNSDLEIRKFQQDLRACTEGAVIGSEDNQYSETKFLQVKEIIDRFRGREQLTEIDKRWTAKVTDVRNWFLFSAIERWRADDMEYEYYPDSGGKSGGQKEKLAYTILAASLAYQFGLEFGVTRSRSFRFVMIDEAFGRGSDESAQYGLQLFKQLNLQLLIVTPLQKIHIIEPFVSSVGFVQNPVGCDSRLLNLTIEEHLKLKQGNRE